MNIIENNENYVNIPCFGNTVVGWYKYVNEVNKIPKLSADEEKALFTRIREGDEAAKKELFVHNLSVPIECLSSYKFFLKSDIERFHDYAQIANIALLQAIEHYDPESDARFSTYAFTIIRHCIIKEDRKNRPFILTKYTYDKYVEICKARKNNSSRYANDMTTEELSEITGIAEEEISTLLDSMENTVSIDVTEADKTEIALLDAKAYRDYEENGGFAEKIIEDDIVAKLYQGVEQLPEEENFTIEHRYELTSHGEKQREMTLQEIGDRLGKTRQAVAYIEKKAIIHLRAFLEEEGYTTYA